MDAAGHAWFDGGRNDKSIARAHEYMAPVRGAMRFIADHIDASRRKTAAFVHPEDTSQEVPNVYAQIMTDLMKQAIERVTALPAAQQDDLARAMLRLAGDAEGDVYQLTPEEHAAIDEADAAIARGDFATAEEMQTTFDEFKL